MQQVYERILGHFRVFRWGSCFIDTLDNGLLVGQEVFNLGHDFLTFIYNLRVTTEGEARDIAGGYFTTDRRFFGMTNFFKGLYYTVICLEFNLLEYLTFLCVNAFEFLLEAKQVLGWLRVFLSRSSIHDRLLGLSSCVSWSLLCVQLRFWLLRRSHIILALCLGRRLLHS